MSRIPLLVTALVGGGLALAVASSEPRALASAAPLAVASGEPPPSGAEPVNPEDCRTCHEAAVAGLQHTAHAGVAQRCESCHLGAAAHMQAQMEGKEAPGPSLRKMKAADVTATCLTCHDTGRQAAFGGGVHDRRGVSCISCHSVHAFKSDRAQIKTARDMDTCFTCHQAIRAKSLRSSHHPVREGRLDCAVCHDPHDSTHPKMVNAEWVNEKCYECHTEKRGPFLWEHAPVRENCMLCHDPHGSNHDKLLVAKQPYLCQRCHLNTRHPGSLYDARNTAGGTSVSNRAVEHSCKNCHQNVHGSNAPSGAYLGR
jgi:DmsE family decaheme c-type cytochrome